MHGAEGGSWRLEQLHATGNFTFVTQQRQKASSFTCAFTEPSTAACSTPLKANKETTNCFSCAALARRRLLARVSRGRA
jgi:hypothetical protein